MTLELHIAGPGLDVKRALEPGAAPLVLGRDAECGVCLPDPQRNVSRRHLSVWNEGGELHFHVLSVVNGIEMPFGEAPPGARGVLPAGQTLKVAEYAVTVVEAAAAPAAAATDDPWAVFDRDASGIAPVPPELNARPASKERIEEDPFGDWGFETTFGPGGIAGEALEAGSLGAARDLGAFFRGLGLDPKRVGTLSEGELEALGRLVRAIAIGLLDLHSAAGDVKQELHAEDRTTVSSRESMRNPLKSQWPEDHKLQYLFGGRAASAGHVAPERAVADLLGDLLAHESAAASAVRATVEGTLREFDPETLKARLLTGGGKLFESSRAWDAYCRHYAERSQHLPHWVQQLLDRHFAEEYVRESQRIKRSTGPRRR